MHEVVTYNVPFYPQEESGWCGAACAQMIMNGYPDPLDRIWKSQEDCYNKASDNNSPDPTDQAQLWHTDPIGLRACLRNFNPPPGGDWSVFSNTLPKEEMFHILYWMNKNHYPVATLVQGGYHWVVIVNAKTDVEPTAGSSPELLYISAHNPEPVDTGSYEGDIPQNVWFDVYAHWGNSVGVDGTWKDNYVAVIEPPVAKGVVRTKKVIRIGTKLIRPKEAMKLAKKYIDEFGYSKDPNYAILHRKNVRPLEPIIVQEETISKKIEEETKPQYYIVPFNLKSEIGERDVPLARISIMINAFTGNFEGITAFGKPIRYIPMDEAISLAAKSLKLKKINKKDVRATVIFVPSEITHVRAYPFWKIEIKDKILYVDQLGKIYKTIELGRPGF